MHTNENSYIYLSINPFLTVSLQFRWLENVSLKVEAVCGYPPELRGQSVQEAVIFKNCSKENNHSFNETSIPTTAPKPNKPKPMQTKVKARPISSEPNPKPTKTKFTAAPKKKESNELKPVQALKTSRPNKKKRGRQPRIKLSRK